MCTRPHWVRKLKHIPLYFVTECTSLSGINTSPILNMNYQCTRHNCPVIPLSFIVKQHIHLSGTAMPIYNSHPQNGAWQVIRPQLTYCTEFHIYNWRSVMEQRAIWLTLALIKNAWISGLHRPLQRKNLTTTDVWLVPFN